MARERLAPRYPIYIPSKGRAHRPITANVFREYGVPFSIVVEPQEADAYRDALPDTNVLVLPFSNLGQGSIPARNWIRDHAIEQGADRHWQFDDNIRSFDRWHQGRRLTVDPNFAIGIIEEFTDRYNNIGLSGFNYTMFGTGPAPPFRLNAHVYSATLVSNRMPYHWRLRYNEDTDLCLQVLAGGLCTVQVNAFLADKLPTMVVKGGNTDELYQGDGRLEMARLLERHWPGVVRVTRRFGRPQHIVDWRKFDTPLERRTDLDWNAIEQQDWNLSTERVYEPIKRKQYVRPTRTETYPASIAIPSHARPDRLAETTLAMLDRLAVPHSAVTILVADDQLDAYRQALPDWQVETGQLGITANRNAIARHFPDGMPVLSIDDDVKDVPRLDDDGNWQPATPEEFRRLVAESFKLLPVWDGGMWGVNPIRNNLWAANSPGLSIGLPKVDAPLYGFVSGTPGIVVSEESGYEDVERGCQLFAAGLNVLRWNHWTHLEVRRAASVAYENRCDDVRRLQRQYPTLIEHAEGHIKTGHACIPRPRRGSSVGDPKSLTELSDLRGRIAARPVADDGDLLEVHA